MLNNSCNRNKSTAKGHNELKRVEIIDVVNTDASMSVCDMIPSAYQ